MNKYILGLLAFGASVCCNNLLSAQGMAVNTTGTVANSSAMLDVSSTTQGVLVPRMTSAQRTAISSPATGLLVYQTDATAGFYYYNGTAWTSLNGGGSSGSSATGSSPQGIPYSIAGHFMSTTTTGLNYNPANSLQLTTNNGIAGTIIDPIPGTGTVTVSMTIYSFVPSSVTWSLHSVSPPSSGNQWTDNGVLTISSSSAQCTTSAWSSGSPATCTMSVSGVPAGSTFVTLESSPNSSVTTGSFLTAFSAQ